MNKRTFVTTLAAALTLTVCTLAPLSAKDKDDKKPAPQPPALGDEYRLGPGDKLRIEVYKDVQLSQSVQVRPDGKITLPLIGDLDANNRTPIELRDIITTTMTVTVGLVTYSFSDLVIVSRSSIGVWLVASRSPTRGRVIFPSGRTWTDCESCGSL